jgi:prepilin-type N-terminal cleavage/methylation domain-containing protein
MKKDKYLLESMYLKMRDRGFTLIEIMVSIAIVAIIMGIVYATFFNVLSVTQSVDNSNTANYQAVMFLSLLREDLDSIYVKNQNKNTKKPANSKKNTKTTQKNEKERQSKVFYFKSNEINLDSLDESVPFLEFFSTHSLNSAGKPRFVVNKIAYFIKKQNRDDKNRLFVIKRTQKPYADIGLDNQTADVEVANNVTKLQIVYVDKGGNKFSEYNSEEHSSEIPIFMDCFIEFKNGQDKEKKFRQTFILPNDKEFN